MTLLELNYTLHGSLSDEQLAKLGEFSNLYGLRKMCVDEKNHRLSFEYDASRLRETQVAHALGMAGIVVTRETTPAAQ